MATRPDHTAALPDDLPESFPALRDALRAAHAAWPVPASLDARIREMAAERLGASGREHASRARRRLVVRIAGAAALAAAVVIAGVLLAPTPTRKAGAPGAVAGALSPDDLNRDGVVDILDAFSLARDLRDRAAPLAAADANHDGVIDSRDVDALAAAAVRLTGAERAVQ